MVPRSNRPTGFEERSEQSLGTLLMTVDSDFEVKVGRTGATRVTGPHEKLTGRDRCSDSKAVETAAMAVDVAHAVITVDGPSNSAGFAGPVNWLFGSERGWVR